MKLDRLCSLAAWIAVTAVIPHSLPLPAQGWQSGGTADAPGVSQPTGSTGLRAEPSDDSVYVQDERNGLWRARSESQDWNISFDGSGFTAEPATGSWSWGLELQSYGFPGAEQKIPPPADVTADGARLTYRWTSALEEWFVNDHRGLEHGFTIRRRPPQIRTGEPLCFEIESGET